MSELLPAAERIEILTNRIRALCRRREDRGRLAAIESAEDALEAAYADLEAEKAPKG